MFANIRLFITIILSATIFLLCYKDYKRPQKKVKTPPISYIIPCYNDGNTIQETIKSIYLSHPDKNFQLIVVNDKSKDNSKEQIKSLQSEYSFEFIDQQENTGKAIALNNASKYVIHDIIIFIDADSLLTSKALDDMINRLYNEKDVVAVTCPYKPLNKGFLPFMQHMEYNLAKFTLWSYNAGSSAMCMRGWCIAIQKQAFIEANMFSKNALSEDMDLALKLRKNWHRVQQSFIQIYTDVPKDRKTRYKQKIRRSSGGMQAMITHFRIRIKNPMFVVFSIVFYTTIAMGTYYLIKNMFIFGNFIDFCIDLFHITTFTKGMSIIQLVYWENSVANTLKGLSFTILTLPYIIPIIHKKTDLWKIIAIVPYSIIYMPIQAIVWIIGSLYGIYKHKVLIDKDTRAW